MLGYCTQLPLPIPLTASLPEGTVHLLTVNDALDTGIWHGQRERTVTERARSFLVQGWLNTDPTEADATLAVDHVGVIEYTDK